MEDPEIADAAMDVSPAAFATDTAANKSLFANVTAYDVVKAWVGVESASSFIVFVKVRDLPDDWGFEGVPPSESPFGSNASFSGTSLVANFSIAGRSYEAIAKLAVVGESGLVDNYTLWRDGQSWRYLSGSYNPTQDLVWFHLPKSAFAGLADNVHLTKFWVLGRHGSRPMDYAPNARDMQVSQDADPLVLAQKIASGQTVEPQYAPRDYVFGQYYRPSTSPSSSGPLLPLPTGSGSPPAGVAPNLVLSVIGASEQIVKTGHTVVYDVKVRNDAAAQDAVYFTLSSASAGWEHRLSATDIELGPGEERLLELTVAAGSAAAGAMRSSLDASSSLGASRSVSVLTFVESANSQMPGGSSPPPLPSPVEKKDKDTPGVAAVAVFAALAVLALAVRRGTR